MNGNTWHIIIQAIKNQKDITVTWYLVINFRITALVAASLQVPVGSFIFCEEFSYRLIGACNGAISCKGHFTVIIFRSLV